MKRLLSIIAVVAFGLILPCLSWAQTATFTWSGDDSNYTEMVLIDNQPVNQSNGYGGAIQMNGNPLMTLPQSLGFPNNGYIDSCTPTAYGAKTWGTRSDGTTMDGTKVGDTFTLPASTTCGPLQYAYDPPASEDVQVSTNENFIYVSYKDRFGHTHLRAVMQGGSGTATVVSSQSALYRCGSKRVACLKD